MYHDRPNDTRIAIPSKDIRLVRMLFLLTHLRKVILQDAVALMSLTDAPLQYGDHRVFKHPVFATDNALFWKFKMDLCHNMTTARSPMADSLIANAPAIHSEFRTVHSAVQRLDQNVITNNDAIKELDKRVDSVVQHFCNKAIDEGRTMGRALDLLERMAQSILHIVRQERQERQQRPQRAQQLQQQHQEQQQEQEQQGQQEQ
ncbi:hypothetical protein BGX28_001622, partial [Mortierella sp. GBA30]